MDADTLAQVHRDVVSMESAPVDIEDYEWLYCPADFGPFRVMEDRGPLVQALDGPASPLRPRFRYVRPIYAGHGWQVGWDEVVRVVVIWW